MMNPIVDVDIDADVNEEVETEPRAGHAGHHPVPARRSRHVHPGWALFIAYYLATYVALALVLLWLVGPLWLFGAVGVFGVLQVVRRVSPPVIGNAVIAINRCVVMWLYRVNFLATLSILIALCLAPFALAVFVVASQVSTPVAWLVAATSVGGVVAVLAARGHSDRRKVATTSTPSPVAKRVAIIGAGAAGIVSAKECLDEGHHPTIFEQAGVWGGVWSPPAGTSKRTTGRTMSSSSRHNSAFGDFPMPPGSPDDAYPTHYSEADYRAYLASYVEHFGVAKCCAFDAVVESSTPLDDGGWELTIRNASGESELQTFDHVIVATGLNHHSNQLAVDAAQADADPSDCHPSFEHTANYRSNEKYRGRKVVIVGMGESSSDAAAEIAEVASEVHIIVRSPVLLLPRNTFGTNIAPDHKLSRLILGCPQFVRTSKLMSQTVLHGPLNKCASSWLGLAGDFGGSPSDGDRYQDNWTQEWYELFSKLAFFHPEAGFGITRNQVTKTAPIARAHRDGRLVVHTTDIDHLDGSALTLGDGTRIDDVDTILDATGYEPTWPFLPAEHRHHDSKDRYRMVFHPDLANMSFVGFCRGGVGSVFQAMEMQARWVSLVISGTRQLPDPHEMRRLADQHTSRMIGKWPTKVTMVYVNALAREEVGCEPNMWQVFRRSPRAWFFLLAGPYSSAMYRFNGPHAKPDEAAALYAAAPQLVRPLEFSVQQGLEFILGQLVRFWTSVPPFSFLRKRSSVVRTAVTPFLDLDY